MSGTWRAWMMLPSLISLIVWLLVFLSACFYVSADLFGFTLKGRASEQAGTARPGILFQAGAAFQHDPKTTHNDPYRYIVGRQKKPTKNQKKTVLYEKRLTK